MYTRSNVVGSGIRWNPSAGRQQSSRRPAQRQGLEAATKDPPRESSEHAGQSLRHTDAYTVIIPNESRRSQILSIAEKELENLKIVKEQHRAKPMNLVPRQLGGSLSEAEVRQKQQWQLMQSKYQQKLKREESIRIKKEAEEAEIQKMKAVQREKSKKLEEEMRLQEKLRREKIREHQEFKSAQLDTEFPKRSTRKISFCDPESSLWVRSEAYKGYKKAEEKRKFQKMKDELRQKNELKHQQEEEERAKAQQRQHRRVNNAFLDRLQGESQPGGLKQSGGYSNMNHGNSWRM